MVFIVKNSKSNFLQKFIGIGFLFGILVWYYFHMQNYYKNELNKLAKKTQVINKKNLKKEKRILAKKLERLIYKEAETCVELIGQKKIQDVRIENGYLIIVTDWDADIEPIFVRYGVLALVKSTPLNKKIAIDLKYLVESRYEG